MILLTNTQIDQKKASYNSRFSMHVRIFTNITMKYLGTKKYRTFYTLYYSFKSSS